MWSPSVRMSTKCAIMWTVALQAGAGVMGSHPSSEPLGAVFTSAMVEDDTGLHTGLGLMQKSSSYPMGGDAAKQLAGTKSKFGVFGTLDAVDGNIAPCMNHDNGTRAPLFLPVRPASQSFRVWEVLGTQPFVCPTTSLPLLASFGQHATQYDTSLQNRVAIYLVVAWSVVVLYFIASSLYSVWKVPRKTDQEHLPAKELPLANEDRAWNRGFLHWISLTWVDPLIGRYGKCPSTILNNCEIQDRLPDATSYRPYVIFKQLWGAEVAAKGRDMAAIFMVLYRQVGHKSTICLLTFNFLDLLMSNVGMVVALDVLLSYMEHLQLHLLEHPDTPVNFLPPTLMVLALIFGVPMAYRTCSIIVSLLDGHWSCILAGGIGCRVYEQSVSMPVGIDAKDTAEKPNIVQLLNVDILDAWSYMLKICASACFAPVILIILVVMLIQQLGSAGIIGFLYTIPAMICVVRLQLWNMAHYMKYQQYQDRRLAALRETMVSIRTIKGLAWEKLSFLKLTKARLAELQRVKRNIYFGGCTEATNHTLPWGTTLLSLFCLYHFTGSIPAHEVVVVQRIMMSMLGCIGLINSGIQKAFTLPNNFRRVKVFLHAQNCPRSLCPIQDTPGAPMMRISGTFKFLPSLNPVLQDLDIQIRQGELVAVIGGVGSGKTALLQAMLGELFAVGDAFVGGPTVGRLAYCAQVPWIIEGTLCENVLLRQELELERYYRALHAAGLTPDLQIFDEGDQVQIGTFGIRMSGGQRARISLARAAYMKDASVTVIDDPFASVDIPTADHIFRELLLGVMKDRTRVVVMQPHPGRLRKFDRVLLLEKGRIVQAGSPEEVIQSAAFSNLLNVDAAVGPGDGHAQDHQIDHASYVQEVVADACHKKQRDNLVGLRDTEGQDHASWSTFVWWLRTNGKANLVFFVMANVFASFARVRETRVIATWINAKMSLAPDASDLHFIGLLVLTVLVCCVAIVLTFSASGRLAVQIATKLHGMVMYSLLRAPIDRFYDRHPVGRLINRLSFDMRVVDHTLAFIGTNMLLFFFGFFISQGQILAVVPWPMAVMSIPFYAVLLVVGYLYRGVAVPCVFENKFLLSRMQDLAVAGAANCVSIRANGMTEHFQHEFNNYNSVLIRLYYVTYHVCHIWVQSRVFLTFAVLTSAYAIGGIFTLMPMGTFSLVISLSFSQMTEFESASLMFAELINAMNALQRILAYLNAPHEAPIEMPGDVKVQTRVKIDAAKFVGFAIKLGRAADIGFSQLDVDEHSDRTLVTVNDALKGCPVLWGYADDKVLRLVRGKSLHDLAPTCQALLDIDGYDIVAVNNIAHDAKQMAEEFARPGVAVWIELLRSTFSNGAHIRVQDLTAGYGAGKNVLHGVSFEIRPFTNVGIAGPTGCGKSSVMLCFLRILEARSGRITIGDVDASRVGLSALRTIIGLVPQDPTVFEGTVRHNIDPFSEYSDGSVWEALRRVQLISFARSSPDGLLSHVAEDGGNLSFGQKQLLSLARMVIRQPPVLLLDECTSALDPGTQEAVTGTLLKGFPMSTVIAIAHRLETILEFDQVIILRKGTVAECGDIADVLKIQNGFFANMVKAMKE